MNKAAGAVVEPVIVRPATPNDLDTIAAVERAEFSDPWSRQSFAELVDRPGVCFLVAVSGDTLAGYAVAYHAADEAELANLAVTPEFRRRGIGRQLLDTALAVVRGMGAAAIWLEVRASNVGARALYHGYGFLEVGVRKRYYAHPVEDAIVMRRDTTPR